MHCIHGQHGIAARARRVKISLFVMLILVTLVACTTTETPTAPAGLRDLAVTEGLTTADSVGLTWSQPTDFGTTDGTTAAVFDSYTVKVYQGADESGMEVEGLILNPSSLDGSAVSVRVSGLNPLTQYAFKLVLSNGNDPSLSSDSNVVSATTTEEGVPTVPAVLRDLAVIEASMTRDGVELTWSRPVGFGTPDGTTLALFGSYTVKVYQGADDSGMEVEGLTLTPSSLDESTVSVRVSGLNPLTQYAFKLVLSNNNNPPLSSDSNVVSATTPQDSRGRIWNKVSVNGDWFSGRHDHAAVVFDSKLWVIGGYDGKYINDVWSSSDGKSWTEVVTNDAAAARFSGRYGHAAAVFDDKLWVIGGYDDGGTRSNDVWSSSDGKSWTEESKEIEGVTATRFSERTLHTAVVFDGKLWVIGGRAGSTRFNDVWSSSDGKSWTEVVNDDADATKFSGRYGHAAVVFDGRLWVIGGFGGTRFNDVWSSPDGKSWTEEVTKGAATSTKFSGRENHAAVVFGGKLWVIGGLAGGNWTNDVWSSSDGKSWTEETKGVTSTRFSGRDNHAAAVFDNKLWVIGGRIGSDVYTNDVLHSP